MRSPGRASEDPLPASLGRWNCLRRGATALPSGARLAHAHGVTAAAGPPFALDGSVNREKLSELLGVQTELAWLDYKRECDLSQAEGLVEIAKDVGAMGILGGYLVVGADDTGTSTGLPAGQAGLFDEATLAAKLAKYLPAGFAVRSAVHRVDDGTGPKDVAVVWVAPHPDGWCVFTRNGDYTDGHGKARLAFRAGDVYARHGSRSEPWNQSDIAAARAGLVSRVKDAWRAEHAEETRLALRSALAGATAAQGPAATFTWRLDETGFEDAAVELIRRGDDIPVRRMLRAAVAQAQDIVRAPGDDTTDDLAVLLDRVAVVAALGLDLRRPDYFDMAVSALLGLYGWAVEDLRVQTSAHRLVPVLWLRIAERLYAVGGLAVRLRNWPAVRRLALAPVPALDRDSPGRTWHRDALTQASRAGLFKEQLPDGRTADLSLLLFARSVAARLTALRPDLPGAVPDDHTGPDPLLTSVCQLDFLLLTVTAAAAGAPTERDVLRVAYPNYARADGSRTNPIATALVADKDVREALLPGASDTDLARVLALADQVAAREGARYWGWEGYTADVVKTFISRQRGGGAA